MFIKSAHDLCIVALQNMLSLAENFISKVLARLAHKILKSNNNRHDNMFKK